MSRRLQKCLEVVEEGFDETDADCFFLDVPNPYDYTRQVRAALKPGGQLCCLVPTFNQVQTTLQALRQAPVVLLSRFTDLSLFHRAQAFTFVMLMLPPALVAVCWFIAPRGMKSSTSAAPRRFRSATWPGG